MYVKRRRPATPITDPAQARQMIARQCIVTLELLSGDAIRRPQWMHAQAEPLPDLAPRVRQTLGRLLHGDSEKQIALHLGISPHTIHVYIKTLYRTFNVNSRGELLARFVTGPATAMRFD